MDIYDIFLYSYKRSWPMSSGYVEATRLHGRSTLGSMPTVDVCILGAILSGYQPINGTWQSKWYTNMVC